MIVQKTGDLLQAPETILCQQVNCRGKMGKGLADSIRKKWPVVKDQYLHYVYDAKVSGSPLLGSAQLVEIDDGKYVANLFGQDGYGTEPGHQYTDVDALEKALIWVRDAAKDLGASIALPYNIGCSLGGGNWDEVSAVIERVFSSSDVPVTIYRLQR